MRAPVRAMMAMLAGAMGLSGLACQTVPLPLPDDGGPRCAERALTEPSMVGISPTTQADVLRLARTGLLVLRAEPQGCGLSVGLLTECSAPGRYVYRPAPARASIRVERPRDLPGHLPLADVEMRRAMQRQGGLEVQVMHAGRLLAPPGLTLDRQVLRGKCEEATHVAVGVTLGAYGVAATTPARFGRLGDLVDTRPRKDPYATVVRRQGRRSACAAAAVSGQRNQGCDVPVAVALSPLTAERQVAQEVLIPGGEFTLGSNDEPSAAPAHRVYVDAFLIDATEVSVADYQACVETGRCTAAGTGRMCNAGVPGRQRHPINCVSWPQARAYCAFVGRRLPTEAEWERAARVGHDGLFPWGDDWPPPDGTVNLVDAAARRAHPEWAAVPGYVDGFAETAPVGVLGANLEGARDLGGNVMEWTGDYFGSYADADTDNPSGPPEGTARVVRGSSFGHSEAAAARSTRRRAYRPEHRSAHIGLRCVRPAAGAGTP